jgi:hypothetical protein
MVLYPHLQFRILILYRNPDTQATVRSHQTLLEYAGRIHDTYFPDYVKWEESMDVL